MSGADRSPILSDEVSRCGAVGQGAGDMVQKEAATISRCQVPEDCA